MNYLDLCKTLAVEAGIGGSSGPSSVVGQKGEHARVVRWVKQAWLDLQGQYVNWKFLWKQTTGTVTLTSGFNYVQAPADFGAWDREHLFANGQRITNFVEYEDYKTLDTTTGAQPSRLVQLPNGNVQLIPAPSADVSYSFDYFCAPQELVADNDVPLCPAQFHDVIVLWALQKYSNFEDAPEILRKVQVEFPKRLAALEAHQLPGKLGHIHSHDQGFRIEVE